MTAVLVFLGAAVGAPLRYLTGCLVLGALAGAALPHPGYALLGTGFCGALTTYSTFSYETLRLTEQKAYFYAAMNITLSIITGLGAALLAYTTTHTAVG